MQTKLEKRALEKRLEAVVTNTFDNVNTYDESKAKKGGKSSGSAFTHTRINPDMTSGGSEKDQQIRNEQMLLTAPGQDRYYPGRGYCEEIKIDTTLNVGQIIIN